MYREHDFQRWSAAYLDSISDTWRDTCPTRWRGEAADYDVEADRSAFRRLELLQDIHDGAPLPPLDDQDQAALQRALALREARLVAGHLELTPLGYQHLADHTLDRYLLLDWRTH
jgi:hypothetical protein